MNSNKLARIIDNELNFRSYPDTIVDILKELDQKAERRFSREYLNNISGLMVSSQGRINDMYVALFPSQDIFDFIEEQDVKDSTLFIKHPLNWEEMGMGFRSVSQDQYKIIRERNIALYCAHAPIDNHSSISPNIHFANVIGGVITNPLNVAKRNFGYVVELKEKISFDEIRNLVVTRTGLDKVQQLYRHDEVRKLGVVSGGGDSVEVLDIVDQEECDTYVTGILHFRGSQYARDNNPAFVSSLRKSGLNAIGAAHYPTEKSSLEPIRKFLHEVTGINTTVIYEENKMLDLKLMWGKEI
jgi:putative NIF3 family GTP cyclohydrolase 1 type 2